MTTILQKNIMMIETKSRTNNQKFTEIGYLDKSELTEKILQSIEETKKIPKHLLLNI